MIEAHFENIRNLIRSNLKEALSDIKIAVAWFTQKELFAEVLGALNRGVEVSMIIIKDFINCGMYGLPLQRFIDSGGKLHFVSDRSWTMHNKFCLFDSSLVITGSYNWTYSAETRNAENVILTDDSFVCQDYNNYFSRLWDSSQEESHVTEVEITPEDVIKDFMLIHNEFDAMVKNGTIPSCHTLDMLKKVKADTDAKIAKIDKIVLSPLDSSQTNTPQKDNEFVLLDSICSQVKPGESILLKSISLPIYYNQHQIIARLGDKLPVSIKGISLQNAVTLDDGIAIFSIEKVKETCEEFEVLKFKGLPKGAACGMVKYYVDVTISKGGRVTLKIYCPTMGRWRTGSIQLIENEDFVIGK